MERTRPLTLGLITARGGSIRIPRKNVKLFCGHPLVAWSIIQSRCSALVDETVLTTDDDEIAEIGIKYGAIVIRRPVWADDITAGVAYKHAIDNWALSGQYENIVTMLPTSPLKKPEDLDNLIWTFNYINSFKYARELITFSPDRETFVYKNVGDMTNKYNVPYLVNSVVADKAWNYSKLCGGWGIAKKDYLMKVWSEQPSSDTVIDAALDKSTLGGTDPLQGYSIEPWQCFETDYEHYFKVCEALMHEFILQGEDGMHVYLNYARRFRKKIDLGFLMKVNNAVNYAGNLNQQGGQDA